MKTKTNNSNRRALFAALDRNRSKQNEDLVAVFQTEAKVADRTRTKVEGYDYPTNLPVLVYNSEILNYEVRRTIDMPGGLPKRRRQMTDSPKWASKEVVDNDCTNWSRTVSDQGAILVTGGNVGYTAVEYDVEPFTEYIPTVSMLPLAMAALPEVFKDPQLAAFLKAQGVDDWHRSQDGWKGPKVSLYQGFDLPTFLKELPEALGTCRSYLTKGGLADRWSSLLGKNRTLPERVRAVANERLAYKYGTELLLQDAKTLHRILTSWKERADKLFSEMGTIQKSRRAPDGNIARDVEIRWNREVPFPLEGTTNTFLYTDSYTEWQCNQTLAWKYTMREMKSKLSRLYQLMDSLGVRPDAGIVWDIIPYSFVIDWFFDVGRWLHANVSRDWIQADITLLSMCNSAHVKQGTSVYLKQYSNDAHTSVINSKELFYVETEYYYRKKVELPTFRYDSIQVGTDPWKIGRVLNATALGTQIVLKRRNVVAQLKKLQRAIHPDSLVEVAKLGRKAWQRIDDFVMKAPLRDAAKAARLEKAVERSIKTIQSHAARVIADRKRAGRLNSFTPRSKQAPNRVILPRSNARAKRN